MSTRTNTKKNAMIEALKKTLGVVTSACQEAKVGRTQHYKWINEDEDYKEQVEDIENIALDFVESKLYSNIKSGDTTSIIFYLKSKGKKRGYYERQDIDITSKGGAINQVTVFEIPDNGRNEDK